MESIIGLQNNANSFGAWSDDAFRLSLSLTTLVL